MGWFWRRNWGRGRLGARKAVRRSVQDPGVKAKGTLFQCCVGHYSDELEVGGNHSVLAFSSNSNFHDDYLNVNLAGPWCSDMGFKCYSGSFGGGVFE